eukprot:3972459-Pleurochrysis_carterae.AAC.1
MCKSVHASRAPRAGRCASSGASGERSSANGFDRRGGEAAAVPLGGKAHASGHAEGTLVGNDTRRAPKTLASVL